MPACWTTLLRHLTRHGYLAPAGTLGSLGRLLLRHLTALWRRDVELGLGVPVLPAPLPSGSAASEKLLVEDAISELRAARRSLSLSPPFGICSEHPITDQLTPPEQLITPSADHNQLTAPAADGRLTLLLSVPPASSVDWFQTLQRRRRIWWRELAEDPGNYSLAQPTTDGAQVVFDDQLVVERLRNHGQHSIDGAGSGEPRLQLHVLSSELCLHSALLAVCGDALDGGALRLQERLAPYRRAVLCDGAASEELRALALHIANQLRTAGVGVFPVSTESIQEEDDVHSSAEEPSEEPAQPDNASIRAEERRQAAALRATDGAGVPLTVLLSESTLRDGVCRLRSRDTTLSHQIHVSQVADVS